MNTVNGGGVREKALHRDGVSLSTLKSGHSPAKGTLLKFSNTFSLLSQGRCRLGGNFAIYQHPKEVP